ncbi:MAG: CoB--CoM heterodisulfide reductase iron-sulfur subunit A family protein [Streptosporangiaceae bacterium]
MSERRRIGVYICHCGGNISDFVDVAAVRDAVSDEADVVVAQTSLFACSDGTQKDMEQAIGDEHLDGLVVASCSPKLHLFTFRGVARRAGLNPFQYSHVNVREQDSWAHGDDTAAATAKAISLVRAGIARTRLSEPLNVLTVETTPKALVIGAGIAGLRAAIGLADVGLGVYLVEREAELGGWVGALGAMFPADRDGREMIGSLVAEVRKRPSIIVLTRAELISKSGSFGNYVAEIRVRTAAAGQAGEASGAAGEAGEVIRAEVGSIIVATGTDSYQPEAGEFGYGIDGVLTLPEFTRLVDSADGPLTRNGRPVRTIAYIYCVGNRQPGGNEYCSKFCCTAAVHDSVKVSRLDPSVHQYHLYRDIRTYGKYELLYTESRERGSVYLKFADDAPPSVALGPDGRLTVTTTDTLTPAAELAIPADLVVLVTGMVARQNDALKSILKVPVGSDGFFNEIHPKLRPVETMVDGVLIAGACQGPKTSAEAVTSGLTAVTQTAAILKKGVAELDPLVAAVDPAACTWCGVCAESCPYEAISSVAADGRQVAVISAATCKGCGGCAPLCPVDAIDLRGYTDAQITSMIDGMLKEPVA